MTTIRAFLNSGLLNSDDYHAVTKTSDLHLTYQAWCEREHLEPVDIEDFKKALKKAGHHVGVGGIRGLKER
jgi:hypothetical protein